MSGAGRMLLKGKTAVIYGAGGGIGSAVARAFAREGAIVHLVGRTRSSLTTVADEITRSGGCAEVALVDATQPDQVENHLRAIISKSGRLDISFNIISTDVAMGSTLAGLTEDQFAKVAMLRARSNFITGTAAGRIMEKQGSGVILGITAPNGRLPRANLGGFAVGNAAIEAILRQLALEVGPSGVRVVILRTTATPDNPIIHKVFTFLAKEQGTTQGAIERAEAEGKALKRLPRVAEVANAAVLLASDYASTITATAVNATCGEVVD